MISQPFVSVCVPVYNVEKDLPRCLESLINQTLKEIEIIVVDDGSTDNSGQICDEYARKDSRIKVIHKPNGGLASARQVALELVRGEYYTVCDSDDWVEPDMYEALYNKAKSADADLVLSRYYINYPDGKQTESESYCFVNQELYIRDVMSGKASPSTWSKLFKVATIKRNNITYEPGINLGEDALFLFKLLISPIKIETIDAPFYHYQRDINSSSYTNKVSLKSVKQSEFVYLWKEANFKDAKYKITQVFSAVNLAFTATRADNIDEEYYKKILNYVSIIDIFKYRLFTIKSLLVVSIKILGRKFGRFIYKNLYRYYYK